MDYIDTDVRCPQKAVKLNHSLTHPKTLTLPTNIIWCFGKGMTFSRQIMISWGTGLAVFRMYRSAWLLTNLFEAPLLITECEDYIYEISQYKVSSIKTFLQREMISLTGIDIYKSYIITRRIIREFLSTIPNF